MKDLRLSSLAFIATALLTACTSSDSASVEEVTPEPKAIAFNTYLQRSTRGTIATTDNVSGKGGVGIYAMYTNNSKYGKPPPQGDGTTYVPTFDPNFMPHIPLKQGDGGKWAYNPTHYWPTQSGDYISFMAYAPYGTTDGNLYEKGAPTRASETDKTFIKHEVKTSVSGQVDLLRSRHNLANMQLLPDGNAKADGGDDAFTTIDGQRAVNIKLVHATVRLAVVVTAPFLEESDNFNSSDLEGNTRITVNKIVLLGDNTSAESENPKGAFTPSAYLNLAGSVTGKAGEYEETLWADTASTNQLAFSYDKFATGLFSESYSYNKAPRLLWKQDSVDSQEVESNTLIAKRENVSASASSNAVGTKGGDYLFLIPQNFTKEKPLYCYVSFSLSYADTPGSGVSYSAYGKVVKDFKAGGAYVLHIAIGKRGGGGGGTDLIPINFAVNVEEWADEQSVPITI